MSVQSIDNIETAKRALAHFVKSTYAALERADYDAASRAAAAAHACDSYLYLDDSELHGSFADYFEGKCADKDARLSVEYIADCLTRGEPDMTVY
jgi:hypothetical protein